MTHQSPMVSCLFLGVESLDRARGLRTLGGRGLGLSVGLGPLAAGGGRRTAGRGGRGSFPALAPLWDSTS